jgi:hypothetical protein
MRLFGKGDNVSDHNDRPTFQIEPFTLRFHNEFPILSRGASFQNFTQDSAVDSTIRSEFEDGTILTRARFTRMRKMFNVGYGFLTAADKILLENLQTAIKIGANTFFWTNPSDSTEYEVRLIAPMKFQVEPREFNFHNVRLNMAQV